MMDKLLELLPIVSCKEATRLASLRMERRLTIRELIDLKLHLMVCSLCQEFERQIKLIRGFCQQYKPHQEKKLSTDKKLTLKNKITQELS